MEKGLRDDAIDELKTALTLDPTNADLDRHRKDLRSFGGGLRSGRSL